MSNQQYVTQQAYQFDEDSTLMSTTDENSYITYANQDFVEVSGYDRAELSGQPHNLVRHPDMPKAAFADLWATLKMGRPWTGLVKNRRKNGDHYWVRANVMPMIRNGKITSYMSVRIKPEDEEIAAAQTLYQQMREGTLRGWRLHQGLLLRSGWLRPLSWSKTMPLRWRIRSGVSFCWLGIGASALTAGMQGMPLAIFGGLSLLVALLTCGWLEQQISRPMEKVYKQALDVASGASHKAEHLDRVDEVGMTLRAVNQLGLMFRWLVQDVRDQVMNVHQASDELAMGNEKISDHTEQTAASVQQTAAAMHQMTAAVNVNAQSTEQANEWSITASNAAARGGEVMQQVVGTMDDIAESSKQIASITGLIDSIAFQTNILALNAAVEAARAGDQGKGFAVVAGEVRNLAKRSASAASDIRQLIEASVLKVESGAGQVHQAGQTISDIVEKVQNVTEMLQQISTATREQEAGLNEVGKAVEDLDRITHQNASLVEEGAQASTRMKNQARLLVDALEVFR
ncbi:Aerotaxis receptor [Mixta theicola]|nr:PAS domain-containing methyl-accepting chemotaxis protein [Mixta theicola]QHM76835.1 Aerotaxis receptor [Mixta theicola]